MNGGVCVCVCVGGGGGGVRRWEKLDLAIIGLKLKIERRMGVGGEGCIKKYYITTILRVFSRY